MVCVVMGNCVCALFAVGNGVCVSEKWNQNKFKIRSSNKLC